MTFFNWNNNWFECNSYMAIVKHRLRPCLSRVGHNSLGLIEDNLRESSGSLFFFFGGGGGVTVDYLEQFSVISKVPMILIKDNIYQYPRICCNFQIKTLFLFAVYILLLQT